MFSTSKFSKNHAPIQRFPTKILNSGLIVAKCAILKALKKSCFLKTKTKNAYDL